MNPIASGGYAWVVFTSRRMYGNVAQIAPWTSDPRHYPWLDQVTDKKLWVAAVDLNAAPGTDASHPAFYLPGQELHAGNSRGYWTVAPCRPDGQSCMTRRPVLRRVLRAERRRRPRMLHGTAEHELLAISGAVHGEQRLLRFERRLHQRVLLDRSP